MAGYTIYSQCQIEWFNNTCDGKSQACWRKTSHHILDGYATPLQCRLGLMYMHILGKPTDQDLDQYPDVLLTSPSEWDPDYSHPNTCGSPTGHLILLLGTNMTQE